MRAKLLFAALFVVLLWLGLMSFGAAQEASAPLPLEVSEPAALCPVNVTAIAMVLSEDAQMDDFFIPQPSNRAQHAPVLHQSYYRTAYQAFYLSGSAG